MMQETETFRRETGYLLEETFRSVEIVSPPELRLGNEADNISGISLARRFALVRPNTLWELARRISLPRRVWNADMSRVNLPEHTRIKTMRSRCKGFILVCTLNTKPEK
jgi:hypothetical protein